MTLLCNRALLEMSTDDPMPVVGGSSVLFFLPTIMNVLIGLLCILLPLVSAFVIFAVLIAAGGKQSDS